MGGAEMAQPSGGAYADTREAAQRQSALCRGRSGGGEIAGAKYPHLTLFNLSPDGRVEFYVPEPPYGAEHMVAIFSKNDLSDLHAALASMTTPERAQALRPLLEETLKGNDVQIGVIDIYTGAGT